MEQREQTSYPVGILKTGQKQSYTVDGDAVNASRTGQDGEYQKGERWPNNLRFQNLRDGTVLDRLTELVWLKNANFSTSQTNDGKDWWERALYWVDELITEGGTLEEQNCGCRDWRLPNVRELQSLIDYGLNERDPKDNINQIFDDLQTDDYYWSSTTCFNENLDTSEEQAWAVNVQSGRIAPQKKDDNEEPQNSNHYIWAVRAGYPNFFEAEENE